MELSFEYGRQTINFNIIYRRRRTMEIRVEPPGRVSVIVPEGIPKDIIIEKVRDKASWIAEKLLFYKDIKKHFVNSESFMYLGRDYPLQIQIEPQCKRPEVKLKQGKFYIRTPSNDEGVIRDAMEIWYRERGLNKIKDRITYYGPKFPCKPRAVRVKEQKRRWASCTGNDALLFNWRCIMAPLPIVDYIVVHEMCHMVHKNHSKQFWDMVASILPDYKERREWLKKNGISIVMQI